MLIVLDNVIADVEANKKLNPVVTELFLRGSKINISLVFILQSYFKVPETINVNGCFIIKIANTR